MFGFLKDKLKSVLGLSKKEEKPAKKAKGKAEKKPKAPKPSKKAIKKEKTIEKPIIEEKIEPIAGAEIEKEEKIEEEIKEKESSVGFFGKLFGKGKKEEVEEEKEEAIEEEKKGFLSRLASIVTTKSLSEDKFNELFWDLELAMLESNVAVSVIEKIKDDLKKELVNKKLERFKLEEIVSKTLKKSITEILEQPSIDLIKNIKSKKEKPYIVCFFGINGSGKTTAIAKLAYLLKKRGINVVLAAADTFRAAAIDQLETHANNVGVKLIKQTYGSDAAAVAFDAIAHAKAHKMDVVLIDTAGRSHSNMNLMDELKKIVRIANPDLKVFVGDSLTGNDMVEQAEMYTQKIGIDGMILTKADVDEKGGATISASYVTKKPILFIGVGQKYEDLKEFDSKLVLENLGLE